MNGRRVARRVGVTKRGASDLLRGQIPRFAGREGLPFQGVLP
jgi:hypothetical protein